MAAWEFGIFKTLTTCIKIPTRISSFSGYAAWSLLQLLHLTRNGVVNCPRVNLPQNSKKKPAPKMCEKTKPTAKTAVHELGGFSPTHLNNMRIKMGSSSPSFGEKIFQDIWVGHRRDGQGPLQAKGSGDLNEFRRFMGMVSWQPLGKTLLKVKLLLGYPLEV